jgi:GNAT superfamily N-acetyltransferase
MNTTPHLPVLRLTPDVTAEDKQVVCKNLYGYNVENTGRLLQQPGININLALKDEAGQVFGGILCDTFLYCLYIDVLWVHESLRGLGYGKALILEAERIAKEHGCTFAHTCTFIYQAPDFYQAIGYTIFGVLDDYPNGIKQYFLKKRLA